MRLISIALLLAAGVCRAGDLNIHVMLSGEVVPGVYGQVQLGNERAPPLVYAQPMLIEPQAVSPPPVYLHVPPGHARNWRKHCREYNACNRPVYFVRSEEYNPAYERDHERERPDHKRSRHGGDGPDPERHGHDKHDDK